MIRFTIRILVYALVLAISITFAPGITIQPLIPGVVDISATYLLFGILFGLINAFIRPLVLPGEVEFQRAAGESFRLCSPDRGAVHLTGSTAP